MDDIPTTTNTDNVNNQTDPNNFDDDPEQSRNNEPHPEEILLDFGDSVLLEQSSEDIDDCELKPNKFVGRVRYGSLNGNEAHDEVFDISPIASVDSGEQNISSLSINSKY